MSDRGYLVKLLFLQYPQTEPECEGEYIVLLRDGIIELAQWDGRRWDIADVICGYSSLPAEPRITNHEWKRMQEEPEGWGEIEPEAPWT